MTGQSAPEEQVDWAAAERRARARQPVVLLVLLGLIGGIYALTGQFLLPGRAGLLLAAAYVLGFVVLLAVARLHPRLRERTAQGYRVQHALRHRLDPGPGAREKADRLAMQTVGIVWMRWWLLPPLVAVGPLVGAPWDRPLVAVPGALALLAGVLAWALQYRRLWLDARRWVADPPGPAREMPDLPTWVRWLGGWSFPIAMLVILTVTGAVAVVVVVASR
ncbi:hypothetical protein [Blastococcus atacamensis]|uniref:hypothetical protein n=1 Tax=Blastococcus atacamensis TaxID=2070508 RepID=UPI000CEBAD72|nr:hypothetical protein [Blastococcus atacamensis]